MAIIDGAAQADIVASLSADGTLLGAFSGTIPAITVATGNIVAAPRVDGVETRTATLIRVHFDEEMVDDSRLRNPGAYSLTAAPGIAPLFVQNVTPQQAIFPSYVDLEITEMTDGGAYVCQVESGASAPVNRFSIPLNPGYDSAVFVGLGEAPLIDQVVAIGQNRVDVKFNEAMLSNADILNPANYVFDNGLVVTGVLGVDGDTVRLVTTDQTPGLLYTLTVG